MQKKTEYGANTKKSKCFYITLLISFEPIVSHWPNHHFELVLRCLLLYLWCSLDVFFSSPFPVRLVASHVVRCRNIYIDYTIVMHNTGAYLDATIFFSSLVYTTVHDFKFIVDTKIIYHCFLCWPSTRLGQNEKIFVTNEIHSIQNTELHSKWFVHYGMMCLCWYKKHFRQHFTTFEIDYMTIAAWLYSCILYTSTHTK